MSLGRMSLFIEYTATQPHIWGWPPCFLALHCISISLLFDTRFEDDSNVQDHHCIITEDFHMGKDDTYSGSTRCKPHNDR
jgi:hypothetical protein